MAEGFALAMDASFLKNLEKVEKTMQSIINKKNQLGKAVHDAFSQITKSGVVSYVKQLEQELTTLNSISSSVGDSTNSRLKALKKDIDAIIQTNNVLVESLRGTSQFKMDTFSSASVNAGNSLINIFKELKTANDSYLRSLQERFDAEQGYQQRQQSVKVAREQETQQELQRYQQIIQKIKELEAVQKQTRQSNLTANTGVNIKQDAVEAYNEAQEQLRYYRREAKKIEEKYEAEVAVLKKQNAITEFQDKLKLHNDYVEAAKKAEQNLANETANTAKSAQGFAKSMLSIFDQINKAQIAMQSKNRQDRFAFMQRRGDTSENALNAYYRLYDYKTIGSLQQMDIVLNKLQEAQKKVNLSTSDGRYAYDRLGQAIKNVQERIEQYTKAEERAERNRKRIQSVFNATADSSRGALNYTDRLFSGAKPMSLNNMQIALNKLQEAQKKLNIDAEYGRKKYDELQRAIDKVNQRMQSVTNSSNRINDSHRNLINTSDQLMRKFAMVFSVTQLQGYLNKLVSVRKEFELQQRSMQAILQNKAEANKIWAQTVDLAVRSPFRVKELVTYTKQLAAYRIETNKLHDTTRRLADISAGLGVDMSRLILAYGQVRAAEYLRGTELRQFTEAGIPLLDELAKHFTELEGHTISTADVFGMISKRMVAFEDVAAVFEKMTSAGGTFFNMQEIQSKTLHGMISNLHDSIDLMMNDIGKYYDGVFKAGVSTAKVFVDNWEGVAYAIKAVVLALVSYKLASLAASQSTKQLAIDLKVAGVSMDHNLTSVQMFSLAGKRLAGIFRTLGAGLKMAFPLAILAAATEIIYGLYNHFSEMNKALDEIKNKHNENLDKIENTVDAYNELIKKEKQYGKFSDDILEKKRRQILALSEQLGEQVSKVELQIEPLTPEQLDEVFKNKKELAVAANDFAAAFNTAFVENFDTIQLWGVFGENLKSDAKDFNNAVSEMTAGLKYRLDEAFKEASRQYLNLSTEAQGYIDEIKKGQRINETEAQWFSRKAQLMSKVSAAYREARLGNLRYTESINESLKISRKLVSASEELKKEIGDVARDLLKTFGKENFNDLTEEQKIAFVAQMDKNEQLAELGIASDFIRSYMAEQYFGITLHLNPTDTKEILNWQKTFNEKFGDNKETEDIVETRYGFREITDATQTQAKVIERLQGLWSDLNKQIKAVKDAGAGATEKGGAYENTDLEAMTHNLLELQEMLDWFGASYEKQKGKGKDVWGERAKAIQDLRKNYEDLIKTFDKYDTIARVTTSKQDLINELFKDLGYTISDIEFESLPSLVSFLDELQEGLQRGSAQWLKIEDVKAAFQLDLDVKITKQNRDEFMRHIESMFGDYEMSLELGKLNITDEFANQLFGIESVDLSEIRKELEDQLVALRLDVDEEGADDEVQKLKEKLKKVEELERKAQEERLKEYIKYSEKQMSERAKIKFKEMKMLDEIEKTFAINDSDTDAQRATKQAAKQAALTGVAKETREELAKLEWQAFKSSDIFASMYQDLNNVSSSALQNMINQLDKYKTEWSDLPINEMKEVISLMEKLKENQIEREAMANPFKAVGFMGWGKGSIDKAAKAEAESIYVASSAKMQAYQQELDALDIIEQKLLQGKLTTEDIIELNEKYNMGLSADVTQAALISAGIKAQKKNTENLLSAEQTRNKNAKNTLTNAQKQVKQLKAQEKALGDGLKMAQDLYGAFKEMYEVLGGDTESPEAIFAEMGINMSDTVVQTIQLQLNLIAAQKEAVGLGAAMNTAMGVVGWIVMAIQLVAKALSAVAQAHDNKLEKSIQNNIDSVERLQRAYERLEKAIDDAYSVGATQLNYDLAISNLEQQQQAYANMIELEKQKKKTDEEKLKDWRDEMEDLENQIIELEEKRIEALGGFGSQSNYKSAAEEFANAWFDAYNEVGDGISGLEDTFDEFINNVVRKQLLLKGSEQLLKPILQMIDDAVHDGEVTTREMAEINHKWNNDTKDALNSYYKGIYDMYEGLIGGTGELSEIQKGVQNITEPQAAAIEAIMNSMRFTMGDNNKTLKDIYNTITVSTSTPLMNELQTQTKLMQNINESINSIIGRGSTLHTGAYIKVLAK